jgi:cyclopropane fatty-acyl-phospholipid synthase-like methyltransferase
MNSNYWVEFWERYTSTIDDKDEHSQVLRTLNKKPISESLWKFTLQNIDQLFPVRSTDKVLDLCSGNGLLSKHFSNIGAEVTAVDVSANLLNAIKDISNIRTIHSDVRSLQFNDQEFDKVIIYAGIQYFSNKETITLFQNIFNWLKPGGVLFIGDIPDLSKLWDFYNTRERKQVYFENVLNDKSIVGNWFDRIWLDNLTTFLGFEKGEFIKQDSKLIYSDFRFDFIYYKKK